MWKTFSRCSRYKISDEGQVIGPRGHLLKLSKRCDRNLYDKTKGYLYFSYCQCSRYDAEVEGKQRILHILVHTAVLETFVGPKPKGLVCRHLDGNSENNRLDNLKWGTPSENGLDCVKHKHNPDQHGHRSKQAAFSEKKVKLIRKLYKKGVSLRLLVCRFHCAKSTLSYIVNGRTYSKYYKDYC